MLLYLFSSSFSSYFIFSIIITVTYISIPTGIVNLFIGILVIAINDKYVKPIIPKEIIVVSNIFNTPNFLNLII